MTTTEGMGGHANLRRTTGYSYPFTKTADVAGGETKKGMQTKVGIAAIVGLIVLAGAGTLAASYFLSPGAHAWMNGAASWLNTHAITPLTTQHLTVGQGLYMVGLPAVGLMTGLGLCLYAHAKYKARGKRAYKPHFQSAKTLTDTQKNGLKVSAVVTLAVLLAVGACLAYYLCPQIPQALNHQLSLGQSLLYIGLPTMGAGALVNGALTLNRRTQKNKSMNCSKNGE